MIQISKNGRWPSNHARLKIMWKRNPHCIWCGRKTKFFKKQVSDPIPEMATVDHLFSMSDPRRIWHKKNKTPCQKSYS